MLLDVFVLVAPFVFIVLLCIVWFTFLQGKVRGSVCVLLAIVFVICMPIFYSVFKHNADYSISEERVYKLLPKSASEYIYVTGSKNKSMNICYIDDEGKVKIAELDNDSVTSLDLSETEPCVHVKVKRWLFIYSYSYELHIDM